MEEKAIIDGPSRLKKYWRKKRKDKEYKEKKTENIEQLRKKTEFNNRNKKKRKRKRRKSKRKRKKIRERKRNSHDKEKGLRKKTYFLQELIFLFPTEARAKYTKLHVVSMGNHINKFYIQQAIQNELW